MKQDTRSSRVQRPTIAILHIIQQIEPAKFAMAEWAKAPSHSSKVWCATFAVNIKITVTIARKICIYRLGSVQPKHQKKRLVVFISCFCTVLACFVMIRPWCLKHCDTLKRTSTKNWNQAAHLQHTEYAFYSSTSRISDINAESTGKTFNQFLTRAQMWRKTQRYQCMRNLIHGGTSLLTISGLLLKHYDNHLQWWRHPLGFREFLLLLDHNRRTWLAYQPAPLLHSSIIVWKAAKIQNSGHQW